jgi:NAD(P)-dependent dehydrogenase (short-subunit alcohol dehydrogenase family)
MAGIATKSLKGKAALVTGGSRGIGAGIVRRLAADGASVAFTYSSSPDRFRKLCLLVPMERFEGVLPDSELHVGAHFKAGTNLSKLLGACLSTLADNVLTSDEEPGDAAVEVTLDMLGAALTKNKESLDGESPDELGRAHSGIR